MRHVFILSVVCVLTFSIFTTTQAQQAQTPTLTAKELSEDIRTVVFVRQLEQ
jgi:hypothetical protein